MVQDIVMKRIFENWLKHNYKLNTNVPTYKHTYSQRKTAFESGYRIAEKEYLSFIQAKIIAHQIHCERNLCERNLLANGNYKQGFLDAMEWCIDACKKDLEVLDKSLSRKMIP